MGDGELSLIFVNNVMVGLRKPVETARVNVIRKLTRQAKVLRCKKGTEEQKAKNERKAERFSHEVLLSRKLKKSEVAKFVLENTESQMKELPDPGTLSQQSLKTLLLQRAMLRIANDPEVKRRVQAFRKQHPDWKAELPKLLTVLGDKQKLKMVRSKRNKRMAERQNRRAAPQSYSEDDDDEEMIEQTIKMTLNASASSAANNNDSSDECDSEDQGGEGEGGDTTSPIVGVQMKREALDSKGDGEISDDSTDSENEQPSKCVGEEKKTRRPSLDRKPGTISKRSGVMEIKTINMNDDKTSDGEESSGDDAALAVLSKNAEQPNLKTKDSFFLGGGGESSDKEEEEEEEEEEKVIGFRADEPPEFYFESGGGNARRGARGRGNLAGRGIGRQETWRGSSARPQRGMRRGPSRGRTGFGRSQSNLEQHSPFRGSRIDRGRGRGRSRGENPIGSGYNAASCHRKPARGGGGGAGMTSPTDNIHPSWAAKRKQASIAQFSGKKTKFESSDELQKSHSFQNPGTNSVMPKVSDLHPSWAAKKEQKGIKAFEGKKIVFDDDADH